MATIDITTQSGAVGNGDLQLQNGAPMDGTLRLVTDALNTASPLLLSTTGVQITSPLRITTSDASGFYLDAEDAATNNRFSIKRDPNSQQVTLDFASNPAGSTTAVGAIRTFRDGTNLSEAMTFIEDGNIGIGTTAPVGLLDLFKAAAATRLAIRGDAGQNRLISYRTGAVQRFGLYVNNTAESGANAGSNFAIRAYNDAGTLLSTPLFIERSSGNVGINTLTPDSTFDSNGLVTISGGQSITLGLKALQLPTGIATNVISAGLSTRTDVNTIAAGESIIQFGNNLNTYYTGAVNAAKAGSMVRLDTRGVEPNINSSNYSVFQIQTRAAGVADPNYTVPVQIGAAPNGSFIIKTNGDSAFGGKLGIGTSAPGGKLEVALPLYTGEDNNSEQAIFGNGITSNGVRIGYNNTNNIGFVNSIRPGVAWSNLVIGGNSVRFTANGTERVRVTTDGLTFNGDTAAANALDDYEEGTWTMGVSFGGASVGVTTSSNTGTYTKIGRQVTVNGLIVLTSKGSSSGVARITGLPFVIGGGSTFSAIAPVHFENIVFTGQFQPIGAVGDSVIVVQFVTELGVNNNASEANFTDTSRISINFTYFV